jgi:large subunit ribosomal protein L34e
MVAGRFKSRTFRRVFRKTPGGRTVLHHVLRNPSKPKCGKCGDVLKGIAIARPRKFSNMPKSRRTVSRPFGGKLCSKCMRAAIKEKARTE